MLTTRAPCGGAAGDGGVSEWRAMLRTKAVALPFLVDEPTSRRIGEIFAQSFERLLHDEFCRVKNRGALAGS